MLLSATTTTETLSTTMLYSHVRIKRPYSTLSWVAAPSDVPLPNNAATSNGSLDPSFLFNRLWMLHWVLFLIFINPPNPRRNYRSNRNSLRSKSPVRETALTPAILSHPSPPKSTRSRLTPIQYGPKNPPVATPRPNAPYPTSK
jgi:hypothetical protein